MKRTIRFAGRAVLPAGVFVLVAAVHFLWIGVFPERDPIQVKWAAISAPGSGAWLDRYVETQGYWLGFSYGAALAFAAVAFRTYRERRLGAAGKLAIGGVTFSGILAVVGCYLLGCCGSPMLAVYLSLFGATFLPLAKPLMAALTLVSILLGWWWMNRRVGRMKGRPVARKVCACGQEYTEDYSGSAGVTLPHPEK